MVTAIVKGADRSKVRHLTPALVKGSLFRMICFILPAVKSAPHFSLRPHASDPVLFIVTVKLLPQESLSFLPTRSFNH